MKMRLILVLCAGLALTVGITTASAGGGNSDAAKACQKGGWEDLERADGSPFKNVGDCVSYAARERAAALCNSIGGTYSTDPDTDGFETEGTFIWSCNGVLVTAEQFNVFIDLCEADGGNAFRRSLLPPFFSTCSIFDPS